MGKSIDELLSGDEAPAEVVETPQEMAEQPAAEAQPEDQPRIPKGQEGAGQFASPKPPVETGVVPAPVAEQPVPPTEPINQLPQGEYVALRAIRDENRELKQRLAAIEQRAMYQPQPQPQSQQPAVDFWDDPHGYMSQQFAQFGQQLLGEWEHKQQVTRINASEEAAKAKYTDYDEAYLAFEQAVQTNPRLAVELAQSSDPGEYAYSKGKAALAIQNVGSLDALKAQIRAELEAEARAAIAPAQRPVLPSTTAADGSVGARTGPAWGGPKSIDQILGS